MILNRLARGYFLLITSTFLGEIENEASSRDWGQGRSHWECWKFEEREAMHLLPPKRESEWSRET